YAVWEGLAAGLAVVNCWEAKLVDDRARGWLCPAFYSIGFIAVPSGSIGLWSALGLLMLIVLLIRTWSLGVIGFGYSVGLPTWRDLAQIGPYSVVRHPMEATGILARAVFTVANPVVWNYVGLVLMTIAAVGAVMIEEEFLSGGRLWSAYSEK